MYEFGTTFYERLMYVQQFKYTRIKEFYATFNISRATLSRWKKGSYPSGDTLAFLCKKLDVDVYWLLTGVNDQDTSSLTSPAQTANRIVDELEKITNHFEHENYEFFYAPLNNCVPPETFGKWRYGIQKPRLEQLVMIADSLRLPLQYVLTGSFKVPEKYESYISEKEDNFTNLVKEYRLLSDDNQKTVNEITNSLFIKQIYESEKKKEKEEKKRKNYPEDYNDPYQEGSNDSFDMGRYDKSSES